MKSGCRLKPTANANLTVPKNLYIIATMNSADRSIGHIDVAIRRRFGLYPLEPNPEVVRQVWLSVGDEAYGKQLAALMDRVNTETRQRTRAECRGRNGSRPILIPSEARSIRRSRQKARRDEMALSGSTAAAEYEQLLNVDAHSLQEFFNKPLEQCLGQP